MHNLSDEVLCARWIENPYYRVPRTPAATPVMLC
jgi:IS5 family transposase